MRSIQEVLGFVPNDEQSLAIKNIVEWGENPMNNDQFHILGGYAGSGKSSLIKYLSTQFRDVVLCAPTNKAVKVLASLDTDCDCCTIYSLLGLKMEQREDKLILSKADRDKVGKYRMIFIDECGMINEELLDYIERAAKKYGVKVLFIGDPKQLNPIGESLSQVWKKYDLDVLKKVERHDNQILTFATKVRTTDPMDLVIEDDHDADEGVWDLTAADFKAKMIELANAGEFGNNTRAIAWRNKTVDKMNRLVRECMFGEKAKTHQWMKNDLIVFTSPYEISENITIITDAEGVIEQWSVDKYSDKNLTQPMQYYAITFKDEDGYVQRIKVLHEDSENAFSEFTSEIAHEARNQKDGFKRKQLWDQFWAAKNVFANIKHGYALTAHRAQGSTFENVFVDACDILSNSNSNEARRCLYVAVTRPTTRLFLS